MVSLSKQTKVVQADDREAIVEIEGLFPGYGVTLGNALRRVLLSSCEGCAVTSFRIEGIHHEFSTIPGVLEDVIEVSLNLKKVRFHMFSNEPQTLILTKKGEGVVTAGDIAKNAMVSIVSSEAHIATLTDKHAVLDMRLVVEKGMGYSAVDQRKKEKLPIGTIALDANFSPVQLVNVEVENMMVAGRADYNRLRLHIQTDGSLNPLKAFDQAITILIDHFVNLRLDRKETSGASEVSPEINASVSDLAVSGLSPRIIGVLAKHRVKALADLAKLSKEKIRSFKGLGDKALQEIERVALQNGVTLE